ncbi:MAG: PQQ-like beta-propeller repeat protein [Planctomycetota bacterium]|nr:PQQ-like beta-propeller repeat protein [Planctomycetota bacterium]
MNTILPRWLMGICWALVASSACRADDWPQWLGTQRDSVWRETGILEKFPASGPAVKWRVPLAGGYAGPAVADGRVLVTDYLASGDKTPDPSTRNKLQGQERVLCFSAADGKLLWKHTYACAYEISFPAGPRATPTVDGERVYALGAEGDLWCLKTHDGSVVWSRNFSRDYQATTPIWGFCGHPLVDGDRLFCVVGGPGSIAVAFDKHTGRELWRALSAKEQGYCPPTMIEAGGKRQLVIWDAEAINGLDPETGRVYWSVPLDANYAMGIATPRQLGQYLFAGGIVNKSVLLQLGSAQPTAEVVWRGERGKGIGPVMVTPFLEDGYLYGVDGKGELRCVKLATGEQLWTTYAATTNGDRGVHSACAFLVKHGNRFFLANEQGDLIIARLTPEKYQELGRAHILKPTGVAFGRSVWWSHPAFAQRCVFARNDKELVCISLAADSEQ